MAAVAEETKKISAWRVLGMALGNRKTGFMLLFGFASGLPFALFLGTLFAWLTEADVTQSMDLGAAIDALERVLSVTGEGAGETMGMMMEEAK